MSKVYRFTRCGDIKLVPSRRYALSEEALAAIDVAEFAEHLAGCVARGECSLTDAVDLAYDAAVHADLPEIWGDEIVQFLLLPLRQCGGKS
jgi:hypothetical protein